MFGSKMTQKNKTLLIHIGHPKTGTSYIQNCLCRNDKKFASLGVHVPVDFTSLGGYNYKNLSLDGKVFPGNGAAIFERLSSIGVHRRNAGSVDKKAVEDLFSIIFDAPEDNVIISSELLFYYPHYVEVVSSHARELGYNIKIVAYVDSFERSILNSYLQNIKSHHYKDDISSFFLSNNGIHYARYEKIFSELSHRNCYDELIVRAYSRRLWKNENIFDDFVSILNIPIESVKWDRPDGAVNASLPLEYYEAKRISKWAVSGSSAVTLMDDESAALSKDRLFHYYYSEPIREMMSRRLEAERLTLSERFKNEYGFEYQDIFEEEGGRLNVVLNIDLFFKYFGVSCRNKNRGEK